MDYPIPRGPLLVVCTSRAGLISACFFHTTQAAAEKRIENLNRICPSIKAQTYNLPELLENHHRAEDGALEELERIYALCGDNRDRETHTL